MTKQDFTKIMTNFQKAYEAADTRLDKIYDALGCDVVEVFCDISFENILIDAIVAGFPEDKQADVYTDLGYLIYECGFNLADFQDRVTVEVDGVDKHPILTTFEDFYDYLVEGVK